MRPIEARDMLLRVTSVLTLELLSGTQRFNIAPPLRCQDHTYRALFGQGHPSARQGCWRILRTHSNRASCCPSAPCEAGVDGGTHPNAQTLLPPSPSLCPS